MNYSYKFFPCFESYMNTKIWTNPPTNFIIKIQFSTKINQILHFLVSMVIFKCSYLTFPKPRHKMLSTIFNLTQLLMIAATQYGESNIARYPPTHQHPHYTILRVGRIDMCLTSQLSTVFNCFFSSIYRASKKKVSTLNATLFVAL